MKKNSKNLIACRSGIIFPAIVIFLFVFLNLPCAAADSGVSAYLWQSAEWGELGGIEDAGQWGGYQFHLTGDAYATELCGYFDGINTIGLYDSGFRLLAQTELASADNWNCKAIKPVKLKKGKDYYVAGSFEGGMYYRYQCCDPALLPRAVPGAVIASGVKQSASQPFGRSIRLYGYILFGLADLKLQFSGPVKDQSSPEPKEEELPYSAAPVISNPKPSGTIKKSSITMSVTTEDNATCRYSKHDWSYSKMGGYFTTTGKTSHKKARTMNDGKYLYYVRCKDKETGTTNSTPAKIKFIIAANDNDTTPPTIKSIKADPSSGIAGDNFIITAKVTDKSDLNTVVATIKLEGAAIAKINMYDDGKHNDGKAGDDIYGGKFRSGGADPGDYAVSIKAADIYGNFSEKKNAVKFTIEEENDGDDDNDDNDGDDDSDSDDSGDECGSLQLSRKVDAGKMMDNLQYLTQQPRASGSGWNRTTADWIKNKLASYGLENVVLESDSNDIVNVVGSIGSGKNQILVSGAHRDSVAVSPGAVDNGGGTVIAMEIGRVLAACKDKIKDYTIHIVLFDGEERGFYGSKAYVNRHSGDIGRLINFDCWGSKEADSFEVYRTASDLSNSADKACSNLSLPCEKKGAAPAFADHVPFADRGIGYIDALETCGSYYHTSRDDFGTVGEKQLSWGAQFGVYVLSDLYFK